mmetsp:Transcript_22045/g.63210  ORF Transcript_22045/g.63210 Transcript_22045/m.63210 type:complete len:449 (+) Transcript_22045:95-1441(+)|eukprot:CAMPEP_0181035120 /NCGR_PEP_ID=MMETSP1070-20121207/8158_1 /TAXON_ID=265543 /ORGANISM="Minutocellus polymorphus, Strain NH13" /LENGTH=448 /DNA_ID=CAMNT_0023112667 /DNA_START=84 /DNA_END=1430 /DNA_ORIENTATION=-
MSSDGNVPVAHRPNSALTPEERQAKQRIKQLSKLQSKVTKLEKRIAHAGRFNNVAVVEGSKAELVNLVNSSKYRREALSFVADEYQHLFEPSQGSGEEGLASAEEVGNGLASDNKTPPSEPERAEIKAKAIITRVSNELFLHMYTDETNQLKDEDSSSGDATCRKRRRAEAKQKRLEAIRSTRSNHQTKAKQMCRAMTKGEQKESMFDDAAALWGYTRQKFVERARLICHTFLKLHPHQGAGPTRVALSAEHSDLKDRIWAAFVSIDRVCSIGCGPGSDVAGVLALRKSICLETIKREYDAPSVLLLDWTIDQWKATILDIAVPIMSQQGLVNTETLVCEKTDVTNPEYGEKLCGGNQSSGKNTLFITSYLLSEQRNEWHEYYRLLASEAKSGDIFYFCEPKPWQLHILIRLTSDWLDFLWADSSMFFKELQQTDNRAGPGVLVAIRK